MACVDALGITLQICVAMLRAANCVRDNGRPRVDGPEWNPTATSPPQLRLFRRELL